MKVTTEQLVQFVVKYGDDYDVDMKTIEMVGAEQVLDWIDGQKDPRTSAFVGTSAVLADEKDAVQAMHDFFAESWGGLFDRWWSRH